MKIKYLLLSCVLSITAIPAATISSPNGVYSAAVHNSATPASLTVTFNGPSGTRMWTFSRVDALGQVVLGDKGILAFGAELGSDPILEVINYGDSTCGPCGYDGLLYTDPANTSGYGRLPVEPADFGANNPYPPSAAGPYHVSLTGWNSDGMLTGILSASGTQFATPYTWDVMVHPADSLVTSAVPEPATAAMFLLAIGILLPRRRRS